jgi:ATP-dependent Clp protease ATP-binding subunit ClpA
MMLPIFGPGTGGMIIGGTLLTIAALSIIWPYIKPVPAHFPGNAENCSNQAIKEGFAWEGNQETLNETVEHLKNNRHVILVGPSRVGKSLTAKKGLPQAIERGDYPELKGKKVFSYNTTELLQDTKQSPLGGTSLLHRIVEAIGFHRNRLIWIFDEIHVACDKKSELANQLKTLLDEGGPFAHVIAITTKKEYETYVEKDTAFAERFELVKVKNTKPDETIKILSNRVIRSDSKPILEDNGTVHYIYSKSKEIKNAPQPYTALKILKSCITRTTKTQRSPTEKKIIAVSNKILSLRSQQVSSQSKRTEKKQVLEKLEKERVQLNKQLEIEKNKLDVLFSAKSLLDQVTLETYKVVRNISQTAQKVFFSSNKTQLKKFLLLHKVLAPLLKDYIKTKSEDLGVNMIIDKELIDDVCAKRSPKFKLKQGPKRPKRPKGQSKRVHFFQSNPKLHVF